MIPQDFETEGLYSLSTLESLRLTLGRKAKHDVLPEHIYGSLQMHGVNPKKIMRPLRVDPDLWEHIKIKALDKVPSDQAMHYGYEKNYVLEEEIDLYIDALEEYRTVQELRAKSYYNPPEEDDENEDRIFSTPETLQEKDNTSENDIEADLPFGGDYKPPEDVFSPYKGEPSSYERLVEQSKNEVKETPLILINGKDSVHFLTYIRNLQTITYSEIKTNIRKSKHKEDILIYLYELEYILKDLLNGFSEERLDGLFRVQYYRFIYSQELVDESSDTNYGRPVHVFAMDLDPIMQYMKAILINILGRTKVYIKQISIMSEASFVGYLGRRYTAVVVALFYYYLIKAGERKPFQAYNKKRNIIGTIDGILKQDGFGYISASTFYARFMDIGKGSANDPMKKKNYHAVLDLLSSYPKAKELALKDYDSLH